MKRFRLVSLFLAILLAFSQIAVSAKNISIGLKFDTTSPKETTVQNASGFYVYVNDAYVTDLWAAKVLVRWGSDGSIQLLNAVDGSLLHTHWDGTTPITLTPADQSTILIGGTEYRGSARFIHTSQGLTVINYVDLEDYLKGVVPGEMPASWHSEALKAQAVCARNYALANWNKYQKYGFNLDDTVQTQVYRGVQAEHPRSNAAVEETQGIFLKYDGQYANTFFYSSSGGYTEYSENVWGTPFPYLVGVEDPYDTSQEWIVPFTPEEIKAKLKAKGVNIGDIIDIQVLETSPAGRNINVKIVGTDGTHTLQKEQARSLFGLRSNLFTITKKGLDAVAVTVVTATGLEERQIDQPILTSTGIIEVNTGTPTEYVMKGTGFGHGVGMSQYGAKGMAEAGYNFEQILTHYFTGTTLVYEQ